MNALRGIMVNTSITASSSDNTLIPVLDVERVATLRAGCMVRNIALPLPLLLEIPALPVFH